MVMYRYLHIAVKITFLWADVNHSCAIQPATRPQMETILICQNEGVCIANIHLYVTIEHIILGPRRLPDATRQATEARRRETSVKRSQDEVERGRTRQDETRRHTTSWVELRQVVLITQIAQEPPLSVSLSSRLGSLVHPLFHSLSLSISARTQLKLCSAAAVLPSRFVTYLRHAVEPDPEPFAQSCFPLWRHKKTCPLCCLLKMQRKTQIKVSSWRARSLLLSHCCSLCRRRDCAASEELPKLFVFAFGCCCALAELSHIETRCRCRAACWWISSSTWIQPRGCTCSLAAAFDSLHCGTLKIKQLQNGTEKQRLFNNWIQASNTATRTSYETDT